MSIRAQSWHATHTFRHSQFPVERLAAERTASVSVCLPARNEEGTIGPILEQLVMLASRGVLDQIVVVDNSDDATADIARSFEVEVYAQEKLMPELGPVLGKGDAMWRALRVLTGEIVCFLDADSEQFGAHFACGLIGPLLCEPQICLVKGFYRRPFRVGDVTLPEGGGRVTELTARPLLNLFYPELAAVQQPLAGELAARRELLERLPFMSGYGVDVALLLDAYEAVGLDAIAQVDLDVRQNAHQPLRDLGPMAYAVLQAVASRLERDGRLAGPLPGTFLAPGEEGMRALRCTPIERPPLAEVRAAA
ncbi:MAG TPA: glucosyl-3-phosphoglycerate synthase [Solirubrobacteraceae bacterium]|nr:glucosyl-3-phosphoglycerate synthase [Solirubrobacteraceae bacterium]